ncbi:MAG TPA: hypothetical protein VFC78_17800 [Tepidisphaeraceae bacterium]|nr:hypothetical protein [Tepidisphaeraceae bacterium]
MAISDLAERLLRYHAKRPDELFYGQRIMGSLYRETELERLDAAYKELAAAGLLEATRFVYSFFGAPKVLYQITPQGAAWVSQESAA